MSQNWYPSLSLPPLLCHSVQLINNVCRSRSARVHKRSATHLLLVPQRTRPAARGEGCRTMLVQTPAGMQSQRKGKGKRAHLSTQLATQHTPTTPHTTLLWQGTVVCRPCLCHGQLTGRMLSSLVAGISTVFTCECQEGDGCIRQTMSSPEHAAATAVAAARRCESCNMHATCSNHNQPEPPKSRPVHTGFMFSSMPRHAAPLPSSPKNQPPCTTTSHASGPQAPPPQPAAAQHPKQPLYYSTDRRTQHPAQNLQRQTRERVNQRKAQHTAGIQAEQLAVDSSSNRRTAALAGATCRHNTLPPKPRTHHLLLTSAVFLAHKPSRPAPSVCNPSQGGPQRRHGYAQHANPSHEALESMYVKDTDCSAPCLALRGSQARMVQRPALLHTPFVAYSNKAVLGAVAASCTARAKHTAQQRANAA